MNAVNRLNLLLSDILQTEPSINNNFHKKSSIQTSSNLKFAEYDHHSSSIISSIPNAQSSTTSLPPRRNSSSMENNRQCYNHLQSDAENQQQTQPLLNSSTLDDLFRALTLECEQYLAKSSSSYHNKTYDQLFVPSTKLIQTKNDSNDEDYENLHSSKSSISNGMSSIKTNIQVMNPEKKQIVSVNVSSSQTYPLLRTSFTTTNSVSPIICHSTDDDSIDLSSSNTHRKRRRRTRKQPIIISTGQSSSSSDERTESTTGSFNEKKSINSKRSFSTDHRQQRIKSLYDNNRMLSSTQKCPTRRNRRRDVSLQQPHTTNLIKNYENDLPRFPENLCLPLSVLLTSTRPTNDIYDHSQQRKSRLELLDHQYYPRSTNHHNNTNIPTHRIPSYPVY